jgi:oligopeptidase B
MRKVALSGLILATLGAVAAQAAEPGAPVAPQHPHAVPSPFGERQDPWYWLRDDTRKDPAMLACLAAENAWADRRLAPTAPLKEQLFRETVAHIKQDDSSVPWRKHGYWYATLRRGCQLSGGGTAQGQCGRHRRAGRGASAVRPARHGQGA